MTTAQENKGLARIASGKERKMQEIKQTLWDKVTMKLRKIKWRDVAVRCAKTFAQAAIAVVSTAPMHDIVNAPNKSAVIGTLAVSAVAAGVSAVWNMLLDMLRKEVAEDECCDYAG